MTLFYFAAYRIGYVSTFVVGIFSKSLKKEKKIAFRKIINLLKFQVLMVTIVSTYLGFLQPKVNAFFLMTMGIPSVTML